MPLSQLGTWHPHPMPNGAPPVFAPQQLKQCQDSQRSSGAGVKSWRDQLGHLHPFIKSFMRPFHEAFEGRVMLRRMLDACGLDNKKLPVMKEYVNPDTKRNNLCVITMYWASAHMARNASLCMSQELRLEMHLQMICARIFPWELSFSCKRSLWRTSRRRQ